MSKENRTNVWVENRVQGTLVRRLLLYWLIVWMWIVGVTFIATFSYALFLTNQSLPEIIAQSTQLLWLPLLVSLGALPVIVRDYLQLSHRFCGPMTQFRRVIQEINAGRKPEPVSLREKDYWQEFAEELNEMIAKLDDVPSTPESLEDASKEDASKEAPATEPGTEAQEPAACTTG